MTEGTGVIITQLKTSITQKELSKETLEEVSEVIRGTVFADCGMNLLIDASKIEVPFTSRVLGVVSRDGRKHRLCNKINGYRQPMFKTLNKVLSVVNTAVGVPVNHAGWRDVTETHTMKIWRSVPNQPDINFLLYRRMPMFLYPLQYRVFS